MKTPRTALKLVAVPVLALALLTGCSDPEGTAAKVGDANVPMSDVDLLTRVQCDLANGAPSQQGATPRRVVRAQSLDLLVDRALLLQLADTGNGNFDGELYRNSVSQLDAQLASVPAGDRKEVLDLLHSYYRAALKVQQMGVAELRGQGVSKPSNDQLQKAVDKLKTDYRKQVGVDVNPVFSPDKDGNAGRSESSVSVAVSDYAKQAGKAKPDAAWVAGLPADARCG